MSRKTALLPLALVALILSFLASVQLGAAGDRPPTPARSGDLGTGWREPEPLFGAAPAQPQPPAGTQATFSDWWKIVFQSFRNGNWDIYLTSGNGGTQTRLTMTGKADIHPRLNRGCTRIAFAAMISDDYEIVTMNLDGSGQAVLTDNDYDDVMPAWSPDGTRIAFQSYRDGQAEVYVMEAGGSDQVRLTNNAAYDGEPSWSPDGSQIAFTSSRSGGYGIWTMNADGSSPLQRADEALSENPAWAPSGQYIAYDADSDGDGVQAVMRMAPDGTGHTQIYKPVSYALAWTRSWSPDSAYIGWSKIQLVPEYPYWYGYLYAVPAEGGLLTQLSTSGLDWHPDWQSADILPPESSVAALPPISPSPFTVTWSGSDSGGSGISYYDVQMRDDAGPWIDWLLHTTSTSASYSGQSGHTYQFRSRARDVAGNAESWPEDADATTTVETLPPVTAVQPLPQFSPRNFVVTWAGTDPGGSGISYYDVHYVKTPGNWVPWKLNTPGTSAVMSGASPGFTYGFRSRGIDKAGNVEAWPPGDGDASTTIYSSHLSGTAYNHMGTPVGAASVTVTPDPLHARPSDGEGAYSAYVALNGGTYDVTWAKAGYGDLPPATFDALRDATFDAVLPPADNVVADWGFESGNLLPDWQPGGTYPPAAAAGARHTGSYGAALGLSVTWQPAFTVYAGQRYSMHEALVVEAGGTAHIIWNDWDLGLLLYRQRRPDGSWSAVETVSTLPGDPGLGQVAVDAAGTAHVVWQDRTPLVWNVYYASRSADGTWSTPLVVWGGSLAVVPPQLAITPDGALHVVWRPDQLLYARRDPSGSWSAVQVITPQHYLAEWCLAAGEDGTLHAVYSSSEGFWHTRRDVGGSWSSAVSLGSGDVDDLDLAVDASGNAHVTWLVDNTSLTYRRRSQAGVWSSAVNLSGATAPWHFADLAAGPQGTMHALWVGYAGKVYHAWQQGAAPWSPPGLLWGEETTFTSVHLAVDPEGAVYAAWGTEGSGETERLWSARGMGGAWSEPVLAWQAPQDGGMSAGIGLATDASGGAHLVWEFPWHGLLYARTDPVGQAGDSLLSQAVTVPAGAPPVLSFLYWLRGASASQGSGLRVLLESDGAPVVLLERYASTAGWQQASLDLSAWSGQPVTLSFVANQAAGAAPLQLLLDEVALGGAHPDLWVTKSGPAYAQPGGVVVYTLGYGNRGAAPAATAELTDTLPAGLSFLSADPPPSSVTPFLTWQLGNLAAHAGPFTVVLHAQAAPDLPLGTTLTNELAIGSATAELETLNNQAQAELSVGYAVFFPVAVQAY